MPKMREYVQTLCVRGIHVDTTANYYTELQKAADRLYNAEKLSSLSLGLDFRTFLVGDYPDTAEIDP